MLKSSVFFYVFMCLMLLWLTKSFCCWVLFLVSGYHCAEE